MSGRKIKSYLTEREHLAARFNVSMDDLLKKIPLNSPIPIVTTTFILPDDASYLSVFPNPTVDYVGLTRLARVGFSGFGENVGVGFSVPSLLMRMYGPGQRFSEPNGLQIDKYTATLLHPTADLRNLIWIGATTGKNNYIAVNEAARVYELFFSPNDRERPKATVLHVFSLGEGAVRDHFKSAKEGGFLAKGDSQGLELCDKLLRDYTPKPDSSVTFSLGNLGLLQNSPTIEKSPKVSATPATTYEGDRGFEELDEGCATGETLQPSEISQFSQTRQIRSAQAMPFAKVPARTVTEIPAKSDVGVQNATGSLKNTTVINPRAATPRENFAPASNLYNYGSNHFVNPVHSPELAEYEFEKRGLNSAFVGIVAKCSDKIGKSPGVPFVLSTFAIAQSFPSVTPPINAVDYVGFLASDKLITLMYNSNDYPLDSGCVITVGGLSVRSARGSGFSKLISDVNMSSSERDLVLERTRREIGGGFEFIDPLLHTRVDSWVYITRGVVAKSYFAFAGEETRAQINSKFFGKERVRNLRRMLQVASIGEEAVRNHYLDFSAGGWRAETDVEGAKYIGQTLDAAKPKVVVAPKFEVKKTATLEQAVRTPNLVDKTLNRDRWRDFETEQPLQPNRPNVPKPSRELGYEIKQVPKTKQLSGAQEDDSELIETIRDLEIAEFAKWGDRSAAEDLKSYFGWADLPSLERVLEAAQRLDIGVETTVPSVFTGMEISVADYIMHLKERVDSGEMSDDSRRDFYGSGGFGGSRRFERRREQVAPELDFARDLMKQIEFAQIREFGAGDIADALNRHMPSRSLEQLLKQLPDAEPDSRNYGYSQSTAVLGKSVRSPINGRFYRVHEMAGLLQKRIEELFDVMSEDEIEAVNGKLDREALLPEGVPDSDWKWAWVRGNHELIQEAVGHPDELGWEHMESDQDRETREEFEEPSRFRICEEEIEVSNAKFDRESAFRRRLGIFD